MSLPVILSAIYTALDLLHDYILHPIFKDGPDDKDLDKILTKLENLENELKKIRESKNK